jgi:hypothetical protein
LPRQARDLDENQSLESFSRAPNDDRVEERSVWFRQTDWSQPATDDGQRLRKSEVAEALVEERGRVDPKAVEVDLQGF